jgi:hypothetical protein
VLVFAFYQFNPSPVSFDDALLKEVRNTSYKDSVDRLQQQYDSLTNLRSAAAKNYVAARYQTNEGVTEAASMQAISKQTDSLRNDFKRIAKKAVDKKGDDANYVFLSFVKTHLPTGLKGLLIAIIFLAAWGSIAAALNSLAASTVCDFHQQFAAAATDPQEYQIAKWYTLAWGVFCILVAEFASNLGQSLIETVNVLGSLFYGVILGIFLVAFYLKNVKGHAVFIAALIVEVFIVLLFFNENISFLNWLPDISFLWLNAIGAIGVMLVATIIQLFVSTKK